MKTEKFDEELRYRAILAMSLIVCAIASIIVLEHKAGYFIDEYLSLMRANTIFGHQDPPFTLSYTPALAFFQDFLAVHPGHEFKYANIWLNESINVHPPLYYVLAHTMCSLATGEIVEWPLMVINVAFTLLTLVAGYKLVRLFTDSWLVLAVSLLAILALVAAVRHTRFRLPTVDERTNRNLAWQMATLIVPVLLYFLLVAKISPFWNSTRFLYPIFPLIVWSSAIILWKLAHFATPRKAAIAITCIVLVITTGSGLLHTSMYNLQTAQAQAIASASDRADLDCIVVTDTKKNWPLLAMLECKPEAGQYASLTFVDSQDPSDLRNFADRDELMLFIDSSVNEQDVQKLAASYGLPDSVEYIYAYSSFTSYHLTRDTTT